MNILIISKDNENHVQSIERESHVHLLLIKWNNLHFESLTRFLAQDLWLIFQHKLTFSFSSLFPWENLFIYKIVAIRSKWNLDNISMPKMNIFSRSNHKEFVVEYHLTKSIIKRD